jgi:hypothetical protein
MFEITKKDGEGEDYRKAVFVLKAISDDSTRPFMCVLHVEVTRSGSRLVCTDGRRLHVAEISQKIPSGEYSCEITKQTVFLKGPVPDIVFPNWRKVVPAKALEKGSIDFSKSGLGQKTAQCAQMSIAFHLILAKTGEVVNLKYLDDLGKEEWNVYSQEEKHKAILLKHDTDGKESLAVIMPMDFAA